MNYQQGNFYKGVQWMEKACNFATEHFGINHPDTLASMNNLILFYMEQGRKSDVEPLFLKLIDASKQTFGDNHRFTLACMDRLGAFYVSTGQLKKAMTLYETLFELKKSSLGDNHLEVRKILVNLAAIHSGLKEWNKAEKMYLAIINFKVETSKQKTDQVIDKVPLDARLDLARLYESQQKNDLAEKQYQYVYTYYLERKGENDNDTLNSLHKLAQLYSLSFSEEKALQLYEKGYLICQKNRSTTDPLLFIFQKNRAILQVQLQKKDMADISIKEILEKSLEAYGQHDPNTILLMYYSGIQHENMGRYQQADQTFETVLSDAKSVFGATHLMTETIDKHYTTFRQQQDSFETSP
ncbi:MAG: tetratricopeptide repeat protein [Candidatus Magnetomorum sp.]|nr:tetratricopeptide repeat protein [Candidatus Magnetomorum sp.]